MRMTSLTRASHVALTLVFLLFTVPAPAQTVETVGIRALGMGGAFVAVASDSTATWWNPAGIAAGGPFLDLGIGYSRSEASDRLPARRDSATWFTAATPPFGFSYYRLRLTAADPAGPTGGAAGDREHGSAGAPVRSLAATQYGVTLVHTLFPGVHAGT